MNASTHVSVRRAVAAAKRLLWCLCVCLLLAPRPGAAADTSLFADFDGDGLRDQVAVDGSQPASLRVWLSATRTTSIIRGRTPIVRLAARDLDGDRRPELIARGLTTGLQIWTSSARGLRSFGPRLPVAAVVAGRRPHAIDDGSGAPAPGVASAGGTSLTTTLCHTPRAPDAALRTLILAHSAPACDARASSPLLPRPPPFATL